MNYLNRSLILFLILSSQSFGRPPFDKSAAPSKHEFQVYQIDKVTDISALKAPKNYLRDLASREYQISVMDRDTILEKVLTSEEFAHLDQLERDLIIKRMIYYKKEDFLKRYKEIMDLEKYNQLEEALTEYFQ